MRASSALLVILGLAWGASADVYVQDDNGAFEYVEVWSLTASGVGVPDVGGVAHVVGDFGDGVLIVRFDSDDRRVYLHDDWASSRSASGVSDLIVEDDQVVQLDDQLISYASGTFASSVPEWADPEGYGVRRTLNFLAQSIGFLIGFLIWWAAVVFARGKDFWL